MRRTIGLTALLLVVASACGLTDTKPRGQGDGGADGNDGGSRAGASIGASANAGGSVAVPVAGTSSRGGAEAGDAGAGDTLGGTGAGGTTEPRAGGGAGGKQPDPSGGSAGDLSCQVPYAPPRVGPREDGPTPTTSCSSVTDAVIIERFADVRMRVPQGLFYESEDSIVFWKDPCASSLSETTMRGPTDGLGVLEATSENNPWFYEASYCYMGLRRRERSLRCDYFDGVTLGDPERDHYGLFASLLWWREHANQSDAAVLGWTIIPGDATEWIELCTIEGTRGDFGLCDEIRLLSTRHAISRDRVRLGSPELVRTVKGQCH